MNLHGGMKLGEVSIFASGTMQKRKIELTRDHSLKQSYVVSVVMSWEEVEKVKQWVDETYGARTPGFHNPRWASDHYRKWCFRKEADAMLFIMRWS